MPPSPLVGSSLFFSFFLVGQLLDLGPRHVFSISSEILVIIRHEFAA